MPSVLDPVYFKSKCSIILRVVCLRRRKFSTRIEHWYVYGVLPVKKAEGSKSWQYSPSEQKRRSQHSLSRVQRRISFWALRMQKKKELQCTTMIPLLTESLNLIASVSETRWLWCRVTNRTTEGNPAYLASAAFGMSRSALIWYHSSIRTTEAAS